MTPDVSGVEPVAVMDFFGDEVDGLTREQGLKVKQMIDRAFQQGFDQCGHQIRELLGA